MSTEREDRRKIIQTLKGIVPEFKKLRVRWKKTQIHRDIGAVSTNIGSEECGKGVAGESQRADLRASEVLCLLAAECILWGLRTVGYVPFVEKGSPKI